MMMQTKKPAANPLMEIAERIREMREIVGYSEAEMAEKPEDRKSTRLNSSHNNQSRMPSSA